MEETALMAAVMDGRNKVVDELSKTPGLDIDESDSEGYTALMLAAIHRNPKAYRMLIEAGADETKKNSFGYCAQDYARVANEE